MRLQLWEQAAIACSAAYVGLLVMLCIYALQDGDMAGLDGLETVGLDCWEGFGTMSMGRL